MRRVKGEDGKYKMEKFTKEELITGIKNAVQPETEAGHDIKKLLKQVLKKQKDNLVIRVRGRVWQLSWVFS